VRAALTGLVLVAYVPALASPFQFDDHGSIVREPTVHGLGPALAALSHSLRPLLKASYGLSWSLAGGLPVAFHAFNVAVHLACVELVMRLGAAAASAANPARRPGLELAGVFAGALFALHPLQTEAVTYVTGRSASLSTAFLLAALLAHATGVRAGRRVLTLVVAPALFLLALATKETSAIFVLVLLAWESTVQRSRGRTLLVRLAPWLGASVIAGYALIMHPRTYALLYAALGQRSFLESLRYGLGGLAYLGERLTLLDRPCIDPGLWRVAPSAALVVTLAILLLTALVWAFRGTRERPLVAFGLLLFLLQALVLHVLVPRVDVINERHAYLANAGIFLALGSLTSSLVIRARRKRWLIPLGLALCVVLLGLTLRRNLEYRSEVTLWQATVREAPKNPRAQNNLGIAYEHERRIVEARVAYTRALLLEPRYSAARANLARVSGTRPAPPH
jgi:protein O-mannosyl-transferase